MTLSSLLYISRSTVPADDAEAEVNRIVAKSVELNPARGLTGALLFTGMYFAQALEGTPDAIDTLMDRVRQDPRHDQVVIVDRGTITERRFDGWSMAYFGPSQFVSRHVTRLLNDPSPAEQSRAADWLTDLLTEFSKKTAPLV